MLGRVGFLFYLVFTSTCCLWTCILQWNGIRILVHWMIFGILIFGSWFLFYVNVYRVGFIANVFFGLLRCCCAQFPQYQKEHVRFYLLVILTSKTILVCFCCLLDVWILASIPISVLTSFWIADKSLVGFIVISKSILFHL